MRAGQQNGININRITTGQKHGAMHGVFQLAHIAAPMMGL
jgi:hypothetical protein